MLAKELEARLILESFENNPFLGQFYADRVRYAFQVELFFLAERYHQFSKNLLGDIFQNHTVYDYHFTKSAIFSSINLSGDELGLYKNLFYIMERFMPKPDILIYLHYETDALLDRIAGRGRDYERMISTDYLAAVTKSYFSFFKEVRDHPVVIVNGKQGASSPDEILRTVRKILDQKWPVGISHFSSD